jgi:hypothetical protein
MPRKKAEPKIMTPIEGKVLGIKNREFRHGDQIPPAFAEKLPDKFMQEWKPPEKPGKDKEPEQDESPGKGDSHSGLDPEST